MSTLELLPFCDSRGKAVFGVTAATSMSAVADSPLWGGRLPCRNCACLRPTTTLHVSAPLSRAFEGLKSSNADTVVFPEPHVSCILFRQFACDIGDVGFGSADCLCVSCRPRAFANPRLATSYLIDEASFEVWPFDCRRHCTKDAKEFDGCE